MNAVIKLSLSHGDKINYLIMGQKHHQIKAKCQDKINYLIMGQKHHQIKAKCQASENKLTGPNKRCFMSLTDILNTSFLKFGDTIYRKTPSNTFVLI